MYLVSAAPVIRRDPPVTYVGAIVLGNKITNDLAKTVVGQLDVDVGFYLGNDDVASSRTIALDHAPMLAALGKLSGPDLAKDCRADIRSRCARAARTIIGVVGRLPGEAEAHQAFFTVFMKKRAARGFMGTLKARAEERRRFGAVSVDPRRRRVPGRARARHRVHVAESRIDRCADSPTMRSCSRRTSSERLGEDAHGGKYGSIARSVNIHIDKLGRDAKSARTNLDQLLGPAPEGSLGTIDLLAGALPTARPGGAPPAASPPPSDFKFHDPDPRRLPAGRAVAGPDVCDGCAARSSAPPRVRTHTAARQPDTAAPADARAGRDAGTDAAAPPRRRHPAAPSRASIPTSSRSTTSSCR